MSVQLMVPFRTKHSAQDSVDKSSFINKNSSADTRQELGEAQNSA